MIIASSYPTRALSYNVLKYGQKLKEPYIAKGNKIQERYIDLDINNTQTSYK